ncbi:hypothetical protein Lnau_0123 [Legionella nautarum]|uniref:Uncharacterized protein n=1 Tax=Legionella nautarum TaxID=45070 RepID=A0A0W0X445_9GAMM|nr:hypothetical protein [Legionella nautarum]KTD39356.1 hypothetical protein Lnau_0123 [Legionella nautarum]
MPMTLTQWWKLLNDDLNELKPTLSKGNPAWKKSYWSAAAKMAQQGQTIEANIVSGESIKATIYKKSKKFGSESSAGFKSSYDPDTQYLPQVTNAEELIFALTYYRHLSRYSEIDTMDPVVNSFISKIALGKIKEQRNLVEDNANELKRRIIEFTNKPENIEVVKQEFPTVADDVLKQVEKLAEPVEEKLVRQMELEVNAALEKFRNNQDFHDLKKYNQALVNLLGELNKSFLEKEKILREIAIYKKFIEELSENKIKPSDLQNPLKLAAVYRQFVEEFALDSIEAYGQINSSEEGEQVVEVAEEGSDNDEQFLDIALEQDLSSEEKLEKLRARYPQEFTTDSLNISESDRYRITQYGIATVRGAASGLSWFASSVASYTPQWVSRLANYPVSAVSYVIPTTVANGFSKMTKSLQLPASNEEHKKAAFISKAETKIESLAKGLNYGENTDISAKDFSKMSSKQINELADKIASIGHMVNIQKCLAEYRQRQMKGVVKVTQVSVINSIVEWLSTTPFRNYIHDRLLLTLEAKKLEDNISRLIKIVDESESYDKFQVARELEATLSTTQEKVRVIKKNQLYGRFFGVEIRAATLELEEVTKVGKNMVERTGSHTEPESPQTGTEVSSNSTP